MTDCITHEDAEVLNAARTVLKKIAERAGSTIADEPHDGSWRIIWRGELRQAANTAEGAIFEAMNSANSAHLADLTENELHNRTPEPIASRRADA